jgi:Amt family ammonium transporter
LGVGRWFRERRRSDFAGGTVVQLNAGIAGLIAAYVLGKRHGYGSDNFAPHDLSLAVIGMGMLWIGWLGFAGGSALGANSARGVCDHRHASCRLGRRIELMLLEWWTR